MKILNYTVLIVLLISHISSGCEVNKNKIEQPGTILLNTTTL